jgi:cathepsin A (carboxypeptidase C)
MVYNKFAWNNNANVLYVDQPLGTGFSQTASIKDMRYNEDQVAQDFQTFLEGFYKKYPEYSQSQLFITGESFAGHYIPAIASQLYSNSNIKIAGIAIGNGWVDPFY